MASDALKISELQNPASHEKNLKPGATVKRILLKTVGASDGMTVAIVIEISGAGDILSILIHMWNARQILLPRKRDKSPHSKAIMAAKQVERSLAQS